MGLLDDAIREHLELKRRHGADPSELAELERQAFGPARRGPEPLEVPGDPALIEPEVDAPDYEPPAEPEPPAAPAPPPPPAVVEAEADVDDPAVEDLPWEDAATEAPEPAADAAEPEPAPKPEGEDVLEETPEFLQETPEHDRLWFEQRPPRDFDFDG